MKINILFVFISSFLFVSTASGTQDAWLYLKTKHLELDYSHNYGSGEDGFDVMKGLESMFHRMNISEAFISDIEKDTGVQIKERIKHKDYAIFSSIERYLYSKDRKIEEYINKENIKTENALEKRYIEEYRPFWSFDGKRLLYYSWENGAEKIFYSNENGENKTCLNVPDGENYILAPNLDRIIYKYKVYTPDCHNKEECRIVDLKKVQKDIFWDRTNMPTAFRLWSPDSRYLIFDSGEELLCYVPEKNNVEKIKNYKGVGYYFWDPDSKQIYNSGNGLGKISRIDLETKKEKIIGNVPNNLIFLKWDPGNKKMLFVKEQNVKDAGDIYSCDLNGIFKEELISTRVGELKMSVNKYGTKEQDDGFDRRIPLKKYVVIYAEKDKDKLKELGLLNKEVGGFWLLCDLKEDGLLDINKLIESEKIKDIVISPSEDKIAYEYHKDIIRKIAIRSFKGFKISLEPNGK
ncbi:MAG: hypothetical protein A2231_07510 [Candidatus Firestonebacteria bacterium RIFOXYA2_FULL_40_8]|nr:MAG: hypothetical protein A2231_07510 [Candidatus Firestonebacteria bacterium RIFOXYA2_FULL_40_8]